MIVLIGCVVFFLASNPLKESQYGPQSDEGYYRSYASQVEAQGLPAFKNLIAWYSGAEKEPGVKLATQEGKKLFVLTDESVKNPSLVSNSNVAVMMWEQNAAGTDKKQLVFRKISGDKVSDNISVEGSSNATNSTTLIVNNQLLIANEVKEENKKNSLKISVVNL